MDFNATIDLIIRELDEAREIINDLKNFPDAPLPEIELARAKCRNAAEIIALLKDHDKKEVAKQKPAEIKKAEEKPEPEHKRKEFTHEAGKQSSGEAREETAEMPQKPETRMKTENPEVRERHHEQKTETQASGKHPHEKEETPEKETPENQPEKPYVAPIIADTFSHLANRFNEQMGGERDQDFSFMKKKSWSDFSHEIGINDQFYYIREIFNGNRNLYYEAISKLEKAENITDARNVIMTYRSDKSENEAVKQLLSLVKRKFSPNE